MLWPLIIIVYPLFHILRLSPSPLHLRTLRVKTAGGGGLGRSGLRGSGSGLSKRWEWSRQEVGVAWEDLGRRQGLAYLELISCSCKSVSFIQKGILLIRKQRLLILTSFL